VSQGGEPSRPPYHERTLYRVLSVAIGLLFVVLGGCVLLLTEGLGAKALAFVLMAFGINALLAAYRRKPSWLSKIGPLP